MPKLELQNIAQWIDVALISSLEQRRQKNKEWRRRRKLGTLQTLWLMLAVSLDAQRSSLHEILALAVAQLDIQWSVSVAGFCKARSHFSPRRLVLAARSIGQEASVGMQIRMRPLAWIA
jgi:hypothetical protein